MFKVLVTRQIPEKGIELLRNAGLDVEVWSQPNPMNREELYERAKDKDAVISTVAEKIDGDFFNACPFIKAVANYGTHFDNFDVGEACDREIALTYTPGVYVESLAEHAVSLMLALSRHVVAGQKYINDGHFKRWDPLLFRGMELKGKTLGLIGYGMVGQRVAQITNLGFGMHVIYNDYEEVENAHGSFRTLDALLAESDIISVHLPNRPSTHRLLGAEQFRKMKDKVLIINTSRGTVIDEQALVQNIRGGKIGGAALDILSCEVLNVCNADDHADLKKLHNVILTPQIGSSTHEARDAMAEMVAVDIIAVAEGRIPQGIINPEIYECYR
ncbi:MAG: 2-hydroxyacid dehydrogenase [Candidatus Gracilibacteria bacterium]